MLSVFTASLICKLLFALAGNGPKLLIKKLDLCFSVANVNSFFAKPKAALPHVLNVAAA